MAGKGKFFSFHGAFASKADAVKKERRVGGFIRAKRVRGKIRYFVMTERSGPPRGFGKRKKRSAGKRKKGYGRR